MRLPQPLLDSPYFVFSTIEEFARALDWKIQDEELDAIKSLNARGLPPVTSVVALSTMFGISAGLIWSFVNRPNRHYRTFTIPKGSSVRVITAPRVALKIIQKWLAVQLSKIYQPEPHVFGFVLGRSHVDAAQVHVNAKWVFSVDIHNFFPTTPNDLVVSSLRHLEFPQVSALLIARLACYKGTLPQGSPCSPVLSNICFSASDRILAVIARRYGVRLSRYADDIVYSGIGDFPASLIEDVNDLFAAPLPWTLSTHKTNFVSAPARLKVHGLLVSGTDVRLTKGYRKRLRAFRHSIDAGRVKESDQTKIKGHLRYGDFIANKSRRDGS